MKKTVLAIIILLIGLSLPTREAHAVAAGEFVVQSAEVKSDDTMLVRIFLNGVEDVGGLDATVTYDPSKAEYIDGWWGNGYSGGLSDIYHDESAHAIHFVTVYGDVNTTNGAVMEISMKLKSGESYQPVLSVKDFIDSSDAMNDYAYTISYQQANGSMAQTADTSGVRADAKTISDAVEKYGSAADISEAAGLREIESLSDTEAVTAVTETASTDTNIPKNPESIKVAYGDEDTENESPNIEKPEAVDESVTKETTETATTEDLTDSPESESDTLEDESAENPLNKSEKEHGNTPLYVFIGILIAAAIGVSFYAVFKHDRRK